MYKIYKLASFDKIINIQYLFFKSIFFSVFFEGFALWRLIDILQLCCFEADLDEDKICGDYNL